MGGRNRGGQKRGRTQRRHFRDGRDNAWKKSRPDPSMEGPNSSAWEPFVKESPTFEQYYKKQGVVPDDEWDKFLATLRTSLPATFRINASGKFASAIRDQIQHDFMESLQDEVEIDGNVVELVKPLAWYPDKLAWQLNFSRMQLRKNQTLARIHEFLKQENDIGSITRQEAVSMLPPLFLDVQPCHHVLDMCAAPGSKTFQLLEVIHKVNKKELLPEGLVIANDSDVQRCHLLVHQTKRMCSPNVIITNHEAQHFPGLRKDKVLPQNDQNIGSADEQVTECGEDGKGLLFDRVLCDVPCSGDGTIRKAPDIWRKWNTGIGNGLHRLQVQIAMRGVALLKVGGRLVYSTCSLNPVEDEAVVGEILRRSRGCMELVDVSQELPELKHRPGLKTWKVKDKGRWIASYDQVSKHRAGAVVSGMFPLGKGPEGIAQSDEKLIVVSMKNLEDVNDQQASEEPIQRTGMAGSDSENGNMDGEGQDLEEGEGEVAVLPLERCMRILPHDQDCGGFFIAVFQKISHFKVEHHVAKEFQRKHMNSFLKKTSNGDGAGKAENKNPEASKVPTSHILLEREGTKLETNNLRCSRDVEFGIDEVGQASASTTLSSDKEAKLFSPEALGLRSTNSVAVAVRTADEQQKVTNDGGPGRNEKEASQRQKGRIQQQGNWKGVDPVLFLKDDAIVSSLVNFYGIKETFPLKGHLVTRSDDSSHLKRIYYVSQSAHNVIELNFRAGEQLKITSVGLKLFERQAGKEGLSPCAFRISSEGLPIILPHITKQIIYASKVDFKLLLSSKAVPFTAFDDLQFVTAVQTLLPGCCVVILHNEGDFESTNDIDQITAVGCWRGRTNMSLLISKVEAGQLLERLLLMEGDELQLFKMVDDKVMKIPEMETENKIFDATKTTNGVGELALLDDVRLDDGEQEMLEETDV